jgi:hypothetical protein
MRDATVEHSQHRSDDASNSRDFAAVLVARRGQCIEVPEQFVGAVNQVDFQLRLQDNSTRGAKPFGLPNRLRSSYGETSPKRLGRNGGPFAWLASLRSLASSIARPGFGEAVDLSKAV